MTHPARTVGAARVRRELERPVTAFVDQDGEGPWRTARRAWLATPDDCAWRCLMQDDIDLAPDFASALEALLETHGEALRGRPLALYNGLTDPHYGRGGPKDLPNPGEHWVERLDGVQGPVIVLPAADVREMVAWCDRYVREAADFPSADIRPSLWLETLGRPSLCPVPSWVQHRGFEPSLLGTESSRSMPRTAPTFDGQPLRVTSWNRGLDQPARYGRPDGASRRVRWSLWRTWQKKADYELEAVGINPRNGVAYRAP